MSEAEQSPFKTEEERLRHSLDNMTYDRDAFEKKLNVISDDAQQITKYMIENGIWPDEPRRGRGLQKVFTVLKRYHAEHKLLNEFLEYFKQNKISDGVDTSEVISKITELIMEHELLDINVPKE